MIEYKVVSESCGNLLQDAINEFAAEGYVVSSFSVSNSGDYGNHQLYAVIMERESDE